MLIAQYRHRLPADYDMARIRERIATRGPDWDATPGLGFKAFSVSERDQGAAHNAYASFYVWLDPRAAVDMLTDARFAAVIAGFGRPSMATWLPLDWRMGSAPEARFLQREDALVPADADLDEYRQAEAARSRALADDPDVFATIAGLDAASWQLTRFTLRRERQADPAALEILHLARPGLAALGAPSA